MAAGPRAGGDAGAAGGSRAARFKQRLALGATVLGAWLTIPELSVAEIFAAAGFDYVIIDAEHSPWTVSDVQTALAGFTGSETVVLVRIPSHDPVYVKHFLDVGADGIVCPMVRTADEAKALVASSRYPPAGVRGFGPRRASGYGRITDPYTARANTDTIVIPQIEDAAYADQVDAIIELDGVDAICLGPTDLSGSLGLLRQFDHQAVVTVLDSILAKAQAKGMAVCTGIVPPTEVQAEWVAKGARMALVAADIGLLVDGTAAALQGARRELSPRVPLEANSRF